MLHETEIARRTTAESANSRDRKPVARQAFLQVPLEIVERMMRLRAANKSIPVMELFGISDNSWRKLRAGQPLRRSVVKRLVERIVHMT